MSTNHFVMYCKECDKLIAQCRCPSLEKAVLKTDTCEECKTKQQEKK